MFISNGYIRQPVATLKSTTTASGGNLTQQNVVHFLTNFYLRLATLFIKPIPSPVLIPPLHPKLQMQRKLRIKIQIWRPNSFLRMIQIILQYTINQIIPLSLITLLYLAIIQTIMKLIQLLLEDTHCWNPYFQLVKISILNLLSRIGNDSHPKSHTLLLPHLYTMFST